MGAQSQCHVPFSFENSQGLAARANAPAMRRFRYGTPRASKNASRFWRAAWLTGQTRQRRLKARQQVWRPMAAGRVPLPHSVCCYTQCSVTHLHAGGLPRAGEVHVLRHTPPCGCGAPLQTTTRQRRSRLHGSLASASCACGCAVAEGAGVSFPRDVEALPTILLPLAGGLWPLARHGLWLRGCRDGPPPP